MFRWLCIPACVIIFFCGLCVLFFVLFFYLFISWWGGETITKKRTKLMNLNVAGVFHLTRAIVPLLEASVKARGERAKVINIGSIDS